MKFPIYILMFAVAYLFLSLPALANDKPAPTKPVVIDDGAYTSSSIKLHAKWTNPSPESGIVKFRYQIREGSTSGPIIVGWNSVGLATEITHLGLSLSNGKTYYIGVEAINRKGNTSDVGYSDGITVTANAALEVSHSPLNFSSTVGGSNSAQTVQNSPVSIPANVIVTDGGADGSMKSVTIRGNRFYTDKKPYFLSTHFLMLNPHSSHVYFSDRLSHTDRGKILDDIKAAGYNSIFLYTLNQGDYHARSVSPYQSGTIGGEFSEAKIQNWRNELVKMLNQDIRPILWLAADDSPAIAKTSGVEFKRYIQKMVQSFDDLPVMWVVGLEVDEYWSKAQAHELGTYLKSIAGNPVGIHQLSGQTSMMTYPWVDFAVYQEGFEGDWTTIYSSALQKQELLGNKPLLFAEYERGISTAAFQKGLAAAFARSAGVGNGAPAKLHNFMANLPDNMVPSRSGTNLYLTGSGMVAVADLINLTFSIEGSTPPAGLSGPVLTSPTSGSTLSGSTFTFAWSANGTKVKNWRLLIGSTKGANDVYDSSNINASRLSRTVRHLPTDGRTIWAQLRYQLDGKWQSADFQYTAGLE